MGKINSKAKGNKFEREVCNLINRDFKGVFKPVKTAKEVSPKIAFRSPSSGAFATNTNIQRFSGDIYAPTMKLGNQNLRFECKNYEKMRIYKFWNKHKKETGCDIPLLVLHAKYEKDNLVVMDWNDFVNLVTLAKEENEKKQKKRNVV